MLSVRYKLNMCIYVCVRASARLKYASVFTGHFVIQPVRNRSLQWQHISIAVESVTDVWWTKWYWNKCLFPETPSSTLSIIPTMLQAHPHFQSHSVSEGQMSEAHRPTKNMILFRELMVMMDKSVFQRLNYLINSLFWSFFICTMTTSHLYSKL